jgi:DNA-binding beta-propeller fold protein YncE
MSDLSDFVGGGGGGLKPFNDLGTVTGTVNLDVSEFGSFRVKQGAGAITLNVTGKAADTAGYVELFFYPNFEEAVTISGADLIENGYVTATGNMNALNYNNVSFSVAGQDTYPNGIAFNNDGSKLYMLGRDNDSVFQYTLSTPFDLSTASYDNVSFSVAAQDTRPYGIAFNNDGSKMYMVGTASDSVHRYTLSTPDDLSTASYDSVSFDLSAQETQPYDIAFNNDGSKMYILGYYNKAVFQYTLSTPDDLSTASYDSVSFGVAGPYRYPYDIAFNNDGSKMYMVDSSYSVFQYTLSTPFDLSTASYNNVSFDVSAQDSSPFGIAFNNDGSKLYMVGRDNDSVFQYTPSYDLAPPFQYQIIHTGTAATFNTLNSEYSIEVAT